MKHRYTNVLNDISKKGYVKSSLTLVFVMLLVLLGGSACNGDSKESVGTNDAQISKSVTVEEVESLKKRIQVLEDKDAIWSILSRYSLNVDLGRAENFLKLFTDDCVFATDLSGKISYRRGKEELGEMVSKPPPKGQHLQLDYHIIVDGDTATAFGYQNLTTQKETSVSLTRASFRYLSFRRVDGTWLIHEVYTIGINNEAEYLKMLPADV